MLIVCMIAYVSSLFRFMLFLCVYLSLACCRRTAGACGAWKVMCVILWFIIITTTIVIIMICVIAIVLYIYIYIIDIIILTILLLFVLLIV